MRGNPARSHPAAHVAPLVDGEVRPGLYRVRLVRGAAWSAVRIYHGRPLADPAHLGRGFDREPRAVRAAGPWGYYALCNGQPIRLDEVWPRCVPHPIDGPTYGHLRKLNRWAARYDPTSPEGAVRSPVDWLRAPPPF